MTMKKEIDQFFT